MKNYNDFKTGFFKLRLTFIIVLLTFSVNSLFAQKFSTITNLGLNGKSATTVPIGMMPPGGENKSQASVGNNLVSGTKLIIPPNTMVILQSPGGKQVLKSIDPNNSLKYSVTFTTEGENHSIEGVGGQIVSTVRKLVGYNYKVNNGKGTTAASKGTEFTFTDYSQSGNKKASVTTEEGTIIIIDEVPVSINGAPPIKNKRGENITKSVSTFQSAGQGEFTSSNDPVEYSDFNKAISEISNEDYSDIDEKADNLLCLGDLYMDNDQAQQAIKPYSEAVQIYEKEYGIEDLYTIEAYLCLADAFKMNNQLDDANDIFNKVESILTDYFEIDLEDLEYVKEENDIEGKELICEDIADIYELLDWAYDIIGDQQSSKEYYNKMVNGCQ